MNPVGDAFTVGIVLLLLIGAVAFYLYTRLSQVEKRMSLLENILLDLKVATENSFLGFPVANPGNGEGRHAGHAGHDSDNGHAADDEEELLSEYIPKLPTSHLGGAIEAEELASDETDMYERALESALDDAEAEDITAAIDESATEDFSKTSKAVEVSSTSTTSIKSEVHINKLEPNYSTLAVKELRSLAQNRGIAGVGKLSRKELIDALQKKDSGIIEGVESTSASAGFESSLTGNAASIDA